MATTLSQFDEMQPTSRLDYTGDLCQIIESLCKAYDIGELKNFTTIDVGYEDCNVLVETSDGKFVVKIFAKNRSLKDVERYVKIMQKSLAAGIQHPELFVTKTGKILHRDNNLSLVVMDFVEGKTFFELDRVPNSAERVAILEQAAKINRIDYMPPLLFDSWAISNTIPMYDKVKQFIASNDLQLIQKAIELYSQLPISDLPYCFVHGDLTKANVIKGDDGKLYVLDFSVANWYPRIQELAVIAANLLHDRNDNRSLTERCELISNEYSQFNTLTAQERRCLPHYALAGLAMEFMGAHQEKYLNGNDTDETHYWLELGRHGLRRELE